MKSLLLLVCLCGVMAAGATPQATDRTANAVVAAANTVNTAGRNLVAIVNAVNSLNIAGLNLAAGVTNSAIGAIVGKIRTEALSIGNIYTELLGEFGRFVGGSITAVNTLKKGVFVSPLALGVNHLEKSLQSLIVFLEALVSPSVAPPGRAVAFAPFLTTLKAVKTLLDALQAAIAGPAGAVVNALDDASSAANSLLGGAGITGDIGGLINKALGLLSQVPGL